MTEWVVVDGGVDERTGDPPDVSSVFGQPYEVEGRTLIPVAAVRRTTTGWPDYMVKSRARPRAVIEVSDGQVRVVQTVDPLRMVIPGMIVGAWHVLWILKTIRALRTRAGNKP